MTDDGGETSVRGRLRIAEFGVRALARIVDGLVLGTVALALLGLGKLVFPDDVDWWRSPIAAMGLDFVYEVGFLILWAATPGKRLMRIEVVDAQTDEPVAPLAAVIRTAALIGPAWVPVVGGWLPIAFVVPILFTGRAVHDYIARTRVLA